MKKYKILGISLALSLALTGCTTTDITLSDTSNEINLEVSWWGGDSRNEYTLEALREYEKENRNINIDMVYGEFTGFEEKNDIKMFSKNESDVMQINYAWMEKYNQQGLSFYDLNSLVRYIDLSQYDKEILEYGQNEKGEQIALPIALNAEIVWYNKSIYDTYGLELPTTWNDFFEAAKVMRKDGIYPLDMDISAMWQGLVAYTEQKTGHSVFDEENNFNFTEKDIEVMLSFYEKLVSNGVIEGVQNRKESKLFQGKYAASIQWVSNASKYEGYISQAGGECVGKVAPTLVGAKRKGWYVKPATLYSIGAHSKNPEEAAKLLNYMVSDDDMVIKQGLDKGVPCNKKAIEILTQENMLEGNQYETSVAAEQQDYPLMSPYFEVTMYQEVLKNATDQILYAGYTIPQAAKEAYKTIMAGQ